MSHQTALSCWVISDGRRGIENQALGLAEALDRLRPLNIEIMQMESSAVFKAAAPRLQFSLKSTPQDYDLPMPLPEIAIGCGRQAIAPLLALKKKAGRDIFTAYIQDPRLPVKNFDLVICPAHDGVSGNNVELMIGSPNRITVAELAGQILTFSDQLLHYPMPRAALLIGGHSKTHKLGKPQHDYHMKTAQDLLVRGYSLLVTPSRRTPDFARRDYARLASDHNNVWLYDGNDAVNPYAAFLGGADIILVTEDSTNMLTESCATGKPVFTLPMQGQPGKFQHLYDDLAAHCGLRAYDGHIETNTYPPLDETARIAQRFWAHIDARNAVIN